MGANSKGALMAFLTVPVTHSMHLPLLPPTDSFGSEPTWKDTSVEKLFPRDNIVFLMSERSSGWSSTARKNPFPAQSGLKPCCYHYCAIISCRESRSFPNVEYSSTVAALGCPGQKKTKSIRQKCSCYSHHLPQRKTHLLAFWLRAGQLQETPFWFFSLLWAVSSLTWYTELITSAPEADMQPLAYGILEWKCLPGKR